MKAKILVGFLGLVFAQASVASEILNCRTYQPVEIVTVDGAKIQNVQEFSYVQQGKSASLVVNNEVVGTDKYFRRKDGQSISIEGVQTSVNVLLKKGMNGDRIALGEGHFAYSYYASALYLTNSDVRMPVQCEFLIQ